MLKNEEKQLNTNEEQDVPVYNTYQERGRVNIVGFLLSVVAVVILCCVPFKMYHGEPVCYITIEEGKLMLAILISIALFYLLCFDMLAFCVESVNIAFLVIATHKDIFDPNIPLTGFWLLYGYSVLVMITHFLYPYLVKKFRKKN